MSFVTLGRYRRRYLAEPVRVPFGGFSDACAINNKAQSYRLKKSSYDERQEMRHPKDLMPTTLLNPLASRVPLEHHLYPQPLILREFEPLHSSLMCRVKSKIDIKVLERKQLVNS